MCVGAQSDLGDRTDYVSKIQWAPAAPNTNRALEFDVFLPNWPTDAFTDLVRETFLADLANAVPGAEFLMRSVADGSRGVTPRLLVAFGENPNADWLATA
ncbi:hypothetical protein H632_c289p1, partial [Helicosporidium sp. ATCC 50920]